MEEGLYVPEPANEGNNQMEYSSDQMYSPNIETVRRKLPLRT
jgi:hypothetical protein